MAFDRGLDALRLDTDIALRDGRTAVLQKPLDEGNVAVVVLIDFRRVPLPEAVGADALIAKVVADVGEVLLHSPCRERKHPLVRAEALAQAVVVHVLVKYQRHGKHPTLAGLLFPDREPVAPAVVHNVRQAELENITDPQTEVSLQHQRRGDAFVWAKERAPGFHRGNDLPVLLCGQRGRFLVHKHPPSSFNEAGKFAF